MSLTILHAEITGRNTDHSYRGLKIRVTDPDWKVRGEQTTTASIKWMVNELEKNNLLPQLREKFPAVYLELLYRGAL